MMSDSAVGAQTPAAAAAAATTVPPGFHLIEEGAARILFPSENQVFYNRPQVVNRDMSTHVIRHFIEMRKREINARAAAKGQARDEHDDDGDEAAADDDAKSASSSTSSSTPAVSDAMATDASAKAAAEHAAPAFRGVSILEALSATGLRAVRYAKELDDVRVCVANDCSQAAVDAIARNARFNGVHVDDKQGATDSGNGTNSASECVVQPNLADAIDLMMQSRHTKPFDVIDLDPYGTAAIFLDSATQAVAEGGLLCVTCTDMAVLCGSGAEAGFAKYDARHLSTYFHFSCAWH